MFIFRVPSQVVMKSMLIINVFSIDFQSMEDPDLGLLICNLSFHCLSLFFLSPLSFNHFPYPIAFCLC